LSKEAIRGQALLPLTTDVSGEGHLVIGGCDVVDLVAEYGSPLYVYDEQTIRTRCQEYVEGLRSASPDSLVIYASKAFANAALFQLLADEGLGLDVVSGGEVALAQRSGFPMERVYFHGNNKLPDEIELAASVGVGRFVVDNFSELSYLDALGQRLGIRISALIRVGPGVEAHTHDYRKTGMLDSKFGIPIETGQAETAVFQALRAKGIRLVGLHAHIGSQIFEMAPYLETINIVLQFAARMRDRYDDFWLQEFSPGGGWGISYTDEDDPMQAREVAHTIGATVWNASADLGLAHPRIIIEPGRSIVGQAGVALYTVGAIKDVPGIRRYAALDGGMADNIRPALYGAVYQPLLANRVDDDGASPITLAGRYCESGDILVKDAKLPTLHSGDLIALPASGAYNLAMSSNYNLALRPAAVMVKDGESRLIRRRESYDDLFRTEAALD
jgi:diaminopimelate decarboxylase